MAGRGKRDWARAAMCAAALATPLAVSGCASQGGAVDPLGAAKSGGGTESAVSTVSGSPSGSAPAGSGAGQSSGKTTAPTAASSSPAGGAQNGTGGTRLTVSDGSSKILMNGKAVDFGTAVYDQAWSPDGKKVAFIDDKDNLWVANADGGGKTEVAKNSTGEKWTHPAWQVSKGDSQSGVPSKNNILFASTGGDGTLWGVSATAHNGKPAKLSLGGISGENEVTPPQTRNLWPATAGPNGAAVYEHDNGGTSDIYTRDDFLRQQGRMALKDATEPGYVFVGGSATTDPDPEVVFVRQVNGHRHVFLVSLMIPDSGVAPTPKDLTPDAPGDCVTPAVSPDGKTVAYSTENGVFTISADGSGAPKQITNTPGFPAFRAG